MSAGTRAFKGGIATGALLAGWNLAPPYIKGVFKGAGYGFGLRNFTLDGIGRITATLIGHADRPPVFAQMAEHVQYITKIPPREFYATDATSMVKAFRNVGDWYGMDVHLPFTDNYNYEAEVLGAKLIYSDIDMPTIDYTSPLIKEPGDIDRISLDLTIDSGRLRYLAENINAVKRYCGLPKIFSLSAPMSLAVGLRSYPKLVRDMRKDPAFAHELLGWVTDEVQPRVLRILRKETGVRLAFPGDAWSCFPNFTRDMIEQWVAPYNARLRRNALKLGMVITIVGSGDYCEERPEKFDRNAMEYSWLAFSRALLGNWVKRGAPVMVMGLTQEWPLDWMSDFAERNRVSLYGRPPIIASYNARFIREGPVETIVDYTRRVIDKLGRCGRLSFLFPQIPASTPPEHVHAAIAAIKCYGKYPIAEDLSEVRFEMPGFEPYEVWLTRTGGSV